MNILQVLPSLDVGGVETGTVDLARYLVLNGHKPVVVSSGGRLVRELDLLGVRHYALPVHRKDPLTALRMAGRLGAIIRAENIDIIHARSRVPAWPAFLAARMTGRPFVTTAHGYYSTHLLSRVMAWGRLVIVASSVMARHLAHGFGVPYSRIRLVPRGVDLGKFPFRRAKEGDPREFVVGMVSRITPLKGHPDFLKAVGILCRKIPHLKVVIAGDVPRSKARYREELEVLTRRLGLARTVEFTGVEEDVPALLKTLDVLVSATVTQEAFGRSVVEAHAAGVPVVATKVGGVVDIIEDGQSGLLCNARDPADMAEKILSLYKDRGLGERLAREARRNVEERYTLQRMAESTLRVYEEALTEKHILVIKMSSVGDCILSIPSLRAIRAKYPAACIKLLVDARARDVFTHCPYIDERIVCDFKGRDRGLWGLWAVARRLQNDCFDIVVDLQNNKTSHLLAFLSQAPRRYGYDNKKWSFFLNRRVRDDGLAAGPVAHQARVLRSLGVTDIDERLELFPSPDDARWAEEFLAAHWVKKDQPLVGLSLRASARWQTKNWPLASLAALCDRISAKNIRVVITGVKEDAEAARALERMTRSKPVMAVGKTGIMELAALMRRTGCFVTPDSAAMHVAMSVGVPVIALFGPTDPRRHFVPDPASVVITKRLPCGPCYRPHCLAHAKCMKRITVDEVFAACERAMERARERAER